MVNYSSQVSIFRNTQDRDFQGGDIETYKPQSRNPITNNYSEGIERGFSPIVFPEITMESISDILRNAIQRVVDELIKEAEEYRELPKIRASIRGTKIQVEVPDDNVQSSEGETYGPVSGGCDVDGDLGSLYIPYDL